MDLFLNRDRHTVKNSEILLALPETITGLPHFSQHDDYIRTTVMFQKYIKTRMALKITNV